MGAGARQGRCSSRRATQKQAEILVGVWSVERHVPDFGEKLWEADHMLPEVAKLLVGLPRYGMTLNTPCIAEKEQSASHLRIAHRGHVAASKLIDRGVGKRQTELESVLSVTSFGLSHVLPSDLFRHPARGIPPAASRKLDTVGESKNVRQTSVCRGFRRWTSGGNQRQTEVCRTFPAPFRPTPEFANSIKLTEGIRL